MNKPSYVTHNIDAGELIREQTEFYIEPKASYSMNDLLKYFYTTLNIDPNNDDSLQFPAGRVIGILNSMLKKCSVDKILFLIEAAKIKCADTNTTFSFNYFTDYNNIANQYMKTIADNASSMGGSSYVLKRRLHFN